MGEQKSDVLQGTLDLMVLKTLETMGPLHGYGIARRIEQVSGNSLTLSQGTIYPALLRLEQRGWIRSEWGTSETKTAREVLLPQPHRPKEDRRGDGELGTCLRNDSPNFSVWNFRNCDGLDAHSIKQNPFGIPQPPARC